MNEYFQNIAKFAKFAEKWGYGLGVRENRSYSKSEEGESSSSSKMSLFLRGGENPQLREIFEKENRNYPNRLMLLIQGETVARIEKFGNPAKLQLAIEFIEKFRQEMGDIPVTIHEMLLLSPAAAMDMAGLSPAEMKAAKNLVQFYAPSSRCLPCLQEKLRAMPAGAQRDGVAKLVNALLSE